MCDGVRHTGSGTPDRPGRPSLGIVIATRNRCTRLARTLDEIAPLQAPTVVVDDASDDGTATSIAVTHPEVTLLSNEANLGVESYNRGMAHLDTDVVLVLDDDAVPDAGTIEEALSLLGSDASVDAVALHPVSPEGRSEFPLHGDATTVRRRWPLLIAGFLVRREAWQRVGGFEGEFFLYVNDTDLALKLLASGSDIVMHPAWTVTHHSPSAHRRPERWFRLASRNRVWLARRHGRRGTVGLLIGLATLDIIRRGIFRPRAIAATFAGVVEGIRASAPPLPSTVPAQSGIAWSLVRLVRNRPLP